MEDYTNRVFKDPISIIYYERIDLEMFLTDYQYIGLSKLEKWWRKFNTQFIEIESGIGTGSWELIQEFIELSELSPYEVLYLSYNQKEVLSLAYKKYHAYYINDFLYRYQRIVDFDSLWVLNSNSSEMKYEYKKKLRRKINKSYKLIIVLDSTLLSYSTLKDLSSFGIPVILVKDPFILPAVDSYSFLHESDIVLREVSNVYSRNPLVYITRKMLRDKILPVGNYDSVNIIHRNQLNLYNFKSVDMILSIKDELANEINIFYREKIMKLKDDKNVVGERLICMENLYREELINPDNDKVKVFLRKGTVGNITRILRHSIGTKYVEFDFKPDFYHEAFCNLYLDRHYLNSIEMKTFQSKPDEIGYFKYAYALSAAMARVSNWDKVLLILDRETEYDEELQARLIYTAMTRAKESLLIAI